MDFDRLDNNSNASTSSSEQASEDSAGYRSARWNDRLGRLQVRASCAMVKVKRMGVRLYKPTKERELVLITGSFLVVISITILFLYNIMFSWYPKSQYSFTGHNFISEHEASQIDGLSRWTEDFSRTVIPIMCHSHNDYWRVHPLFSALAAGCTGVEADVWLSDDGQDLLVGHDRTELHPNNTLKTMYLDSLLAILDRQNPAEQWANYTVYDRARGVFPSSPNQTLTLLIDVKTEPQRTWEVVERYLAPLREKQYLTHYEHVFPAPGFVERQKVWPQPIIVVATGNMDREAHWKWFIEHREFHSEDPWEEDQTSWYRDFFVDAPLKDLPGGNRWNDDYDSKGKKKGWTAFLEFDSDVFYWASTSFKASIGDTRLGFSEKQLETLREQIRIARRSGIKSRYWDLPSWPISHRDYVWAVLTREGVDMLSVDDVESAARRGWSKGYITSVVWMFVACVLVVVAGVVLLVFICKVVLRRHEAAARAPGEIHLP